RIIVVGFHRALTKWAVDQGYCGVICGHSHVPKAEKYAYGLCLDCGESNDHNYSTLLVEDFNGNFYVLPQAGCRQRQKVVKAFPREYQGLSVLDEKLSLFKEL
ncbi:MAG: hypothetical protein OXQ96_06050, partial [Alphaproteobacteria bacterium]|nr:hypothetical protein [Alphaproteobacteria bacterium]